jgi:predicted AAA+ superfamily ATPase
LNHANSVVYLLDPENGYANREAARLNPAAILDGEPPLLADEWQEAPAIWDAVKFACDMGSQKDRFMLTGSATPAPETYSSSSVGRIARIRMRTMSLFESGDSTGDISLEGLFDGDPVAPAVSHLRQDSLIKLMTRGGWPDGIMTEEVDNGIIAEQYVEALVQADISQADGTRRNPRDRPAGARCVSQGERDDSG